MNPAGPIVGLLALAGALVLGAPRRCAGAGSPNVVLLIADDLGYGETGAQGNPEIPTPNLDVLAREGVRFTDGYVTASFCSPSRAAIFTGRYQQRFGHEGNPVGGANLDLDRALAPAERTLADRFREAGYATALIGKWHLGGLPEVGPTRRGFDEFFGFLHEGHFYVPPPYRGVYSRLRANEPPYDAHNPLWRGEEPVEEASYLTDALTREALRFIDRMRAQPFFLVVAYNAVHSPMQAPLATVEGFGHLAPQRAVFAAMLTHLDESVGAILDRLRQRGLDEQTCVVFLSDNGGPTAELTSSNAPLSGGKGSLREGGIRVPWFVRWPGRLPAGRVESRPVSSLDLVPTLLAAAGLRPGSRDALDGVDLLPFLTGAESGFAHETLYWRMGSLAAVRRGDWKALRERDGTWRLYDLAQDLAEERDRADDEPERLSGLRARWEAWAAEVDRERTGR